MKKMVVCVCALIVLSLAGCGENASAVSVDESLQESEGMDDIYDDSGDSQQDYEDLNVDMTEDSRDVDSFGSIDVEEGSSPSNTYVDWHNYVEDVDGIQYFDFTQCAKDIGYTWVIDPEWDGISMCYIQRETAKYFFSVYDGVLTIYYDLDGQPWSTTGIGANKANLDYVFQSDGQDPYYTSAELIDEVVRLMLYFRDAEQIDMYRLPTDVPYAFGMYDGGPVEYYPNGMIKQRDFGSPLNDTVEYSNRDVNN